MKKFTEKQYEMHFPRYADLSPLSKELMKAGFEAALNCKSGVHNQEIWRTMIHIFIANDKLFLRGMSDAK